MAPDQEFMTRSCESVIGAAHRSVLLGRSRCVKRSLPLKRNLFAGGSFDAVINHSLRDQWIPRAAPSVIPALQVANVLSTGIHQHLRRAGA